MSSNLISLNGRQALITGGGTGIGLAISRAFCDAGGRVILTGRREEVLRQACERLGQNASYRACDVSQVETIPGLIGGIEKDGIALDILVNNAGINLKKPALEVTDEEFDRIIQTNLNGLFAFSREVARGMASRGWAMQLHLGALRNNNTRLLGALGPDTGFDSIGDFSQAEALTTFLDSLDRTGELPRVILYNLNPADNYVFAAMTGNFQDGTIPGKIQLGSGWWFLDQKEGIEWQLNALSNLGLLRRFVGMVTDSRSFLSFPRHEYFRRVLCNLLGQGMVSGELPDDLPLVGKMVEEICFANARNYFGFELSTKPPSS